MTEKEDWMGALELYDHSNIDLNRFDCGPYTWDPKERVIRDREGRVRVGYLVTIAPEDGPKVAQRFNYLAALRVMVHP